MFNGVMRGGELRSFLLQNPKPMIVGKFIGKVMRPNLTLDDIEDPDIFTNEYRLKRLHRWRSIPADTKYRVVETDLYLFVFAFINKHQTL